MDPTQYSARTENTFLRSIKATCKHLPHSNEAADEARKIYFSFLIAFGLPAIFLTVTPDDLRCFRIIVYSCMRVEKVDGDYCPTDFTDADILADFQFHRETRFEYPGLCAEEYQRVVQLVIKHVFNWNTEEQKANGVGLFAEVLAWCLATEEQARKNLHGHFLLFLKGWKEYLNVLQLRKTKTRQFGDELTYKNAVATATKLFDNACSARLFADFDKGKALDSNQVFAHPCHAHTKRKIARDRVHFDIVGVDDQALREMRHKLLWVEHQGKIAFCSNCLIDFNVNDIVQSALRIHHPTTTDDRAFIFPDTETTKRLDRLVYENQKSFHWMDDATDIRNITRAKHYFAANALVNVHRPSHATRCFKKGDECYASIPARPARKTSILYCEDIDCDVWSDCFGNKEV